MHNGSRVRIDLPPSPDEVVKHVILQVSGLEDVLTNVEGTLAHAGKAAALHDAKMLLARGRGMLMVALTGGVPINAPVDADGVPDHHPSADEDAS
jgi:hypothetical protein